MAIRFRQTDEQIANSEWSATGKQLTRSSFGFSVIQIDMLLIREHLQGCRSPSCPPGDNDVERPHDSAQYENGGALSHRYIFDNACFIHWLGIPMEARADESAEGASRLLKKPCPEGAHRIRLVRDNEERM